MNHLVRLQRHEAAFVAIAAFLINRELGFAWWWPLALFLVFDLSAVGYLVNPRVGAMTYNAVHAWTWPAALAAVGTLQDQRTVLLVAIAWTFHVAVDRTLGYGLKDSSSFHETHLGPIGRRRSRSTTEQR